jgi:hypothetical protein
MIETAEQTLAHAHSGAPKKLTAWVNEYQTKYVDILKQRGYSPGSDTEYMRHRSLEDPILDAPPAPGYIVRSLGDGLEFSSAVMLQVWVHDDDIHIAIIATIPSGIATFKPRPSTAAILISLPSLPTAPSLPSAPSGSMMSPVAPISSL